MKKINFWLEQYKNNINKLEQSYKQIILKLKQQIIEQFVNNPHGNVEKWQQLLTKKPKQNLATWLLEFHPWRKGPFKFAEVELDSEWRSDLKWNRIKDKIYCLFSITSRIILSYVDFYSSSSFDFATFAFNVAICRAFFSFISCRPYSFPTKNL